jgi:HlyD family secretion protein
LPSIEQEKNQYQASARSANNAVKQGLIPNIVGKHRVALASIAIAMVISLVFLGQRTVTVEVAYAEDDVSIEVFGLGTVEARVLSEVGFEVGATLVELSADHGDRVSKNAVLARLKDGEQAARVAKALAGIASAEAAINMAHTIVKQSRAVLTQREQINRRLQLLLTRNTVSEEAAEDAQLQQDVAAAELAVALTEIEVTNAKLADARAQLRYDNVLLDQHTLRAPYDAIVVKRHRDLGSVLIVGETLFTLVDTATVWVLAYVDESNAGDIRVGQPAEIRLRSLPQIVIPGHVARIDIESDRVNEERRVFVKCDQCPTSFHLGEQAEVVITTRTLARATLLPETAVTRFDGVAGTIWIVSDDQLQRVAVRFGAKTLDGRLQIAAGLPDGASAVARLHSGLREGRRATTLPQNSK